MGGYVFPTRLQPKSDSECPVDRCKDPRISVTTSTPSDVDGNKMFRRRVRGPESLVVYEVKHDLLSFLWLKE